MFWGKVQEYFEVQMGEMGKSRFMQQSVPTTLPFQVALPGLFETPVCPDKRERVTPKEEGGRKETEEGDTGKGECLEVISPPAKKVQEQYGLSQCYKMFLPSSVLQEDPYPPMLSSSRLSISTC